MEVTLKFKLLVIGIVVFLTTFAIAVYINTFLVGSRASATAIPITITEKSGSIAGTKDIAATFNTAGKISGFIFNLKTTGMIAVKDSKEPIILGSTAATPAGFFAQHEKTASRISYTISKPDAELPVAVSLPITLTCTGVGSGTFTIDGPSSELVGPGGPYTLAPVDTGSYTCTSVGTAPTPTITQTTGPQAHFSPDSGKAAVGEQITTNLLLDGFPTGQQISAFDATMTVPDGVTVSFTDPSNACKTIIKSFDATTHIARVSQVCPGTTLLTSAQVPIILKGSKDVTGKIVISNLEVVGPQAPNGYTVSKDSLSIQIGAGGSTGGGSAGNMHLILTLRLQGIQAKPKQTNPLQFRIGVTNSTMESPVYQNSSFTPDDSGLYHGNVGITAPTGSGLCIFVKGPFHLQKKICDQQPTETFPGTYSGDKGRITLTNGDNTFDFSKVYQMSCDLPAQDGICNSYDMAFLRENLGKTDASALAGGDINQDGVVNGQDYALAIASLSIKVDDK